MINKQKTIWLDLFYKNIKIKKKKNVAFGIWLQLLQIPKQIY